ncbi:hypothetical protein ACJMK2_033583, partial [Sinanodonta woodiana]
PEIQLHCSSYIQSCLDSAGIGKFSNAWTLIALTNAINMNIRMIYPYASDIAYKTLNTEFKLSGTFDNRRQLVIYWYKSRHVPTLGPGKWYAVHTIAYPSTDGNVVDYCVSHKRKLSTSSSWHRHHCSNVSLISMESDFSSSNKFDNLQELIDVDTDNEADIYFTKEKDNSLATVPL